MQLYSFREDIKTLYRIGNIPKFLADLGVHYEETKTGYSLKLPDKSIDVIVKSRRLECLLVRNQKEKGSEWGYTSRLLVQQDKYGYLALHRIFGEAVFVSDKNIITTYKINGELHIWGDRQFHKAPSEAIAVWKKALNDNVRLPRTALRAIYWPEVKGFTRVSPFIMSGLPREAGEALELAGVPFPEHFRDAEGVSPEVVRGCTLPGMFPLVAVRFPDSLLDREIYSSGLVCFHTVSRLGERWLFCAATEADWKISVGSYLYADAGGLRVGKSRQSW